MPLVSPAIERLSGQAEITPEIVHDTLKISLAGTAMAQWEPLRQRLALALDPERSWSLHLFRPLQEAYSHLSSSSLDEKQVLVELLRKAAAIVMEDAEDLETAFERKEITPSELGEALNKAAHIGELANLYLSKEHASFLDLEGRTYQARERLTAMRAARIREIAEQAYSLLMQRYSSLASYTNPVAKDIAVQVKRGTMDLRTFVTVYERTHDVGESKQAAILVKGESMDLKAFGQGYKQ